MDIIEQKRILLFSTGQDSFILKQIFEFADEECLFVRMGTKENAIEEQYIDKYFPGVRKVDMPIADFELINKIIPFRNHLLTLLAAQFSANIYFAFTAGDTTKDKDYVFKAQMEGLLNYFALDQHKVRITKPYRLHMPYKDMTKTEMVAGYLDNDLDPADLWTKSCSCYEGTDIPCGVCRSCLRKFVSLTLNGITMEFQNDPTPYLEEFLEESKRKGRKQEVTDIENCIIRIKK